MSFMERQIEFGEWIEVDGNCGIDYVPADIVGNVDLSAWEECDKPQDIPAELADYCENTRAWSIKRITGYGARLSAPGYMDCTEWSVFDTEAEAIAYLEEYYPDDDEEEGETP